MDLLTSMAILLVLLWVAGLTTGIGGAPLHLLLAIALVVFVIALLRRN